MQALARVFFQVHAGDTDFFRRAIDLDFNQPMLRQRLVKLGNLIALGQIGIEIVLAGEDRSFVDAAVQRHSRERGKLHGFTVQHGKSPGKPRHTGQTLVFGGAPKWVEHEQKILVAVRSWTCTSSPITGSYLARADTKCLAWWP